TVAPLCAPAPRCCPDRAGATAVNDIYRIFAGALWILLVVTVVWPLNLPWLALAYKVRHGHKPIPMEPVEFWVRTTLASLALALLALLAFGVRAVALNVMELREIEGLVYTVLFLVCVPAGVLLVAWLYAFDDLTEALGVYLVYLIAPGLVLLALYWLF